MELIQTDLPEPVAPRDQYVRHFSQIGNNDLALKYPRPMQRSVYFWLYQIGGVNFPA